VLCLSRLCAPILPSNRLLCGLPLFLFASCPTRPWQIAPRPAVLDPIESRRRRPPSAESVENSRRMVFAFAAISALLIVPVAAMSFHSQQEDDRPVVDLSFQRMGKTVDTWLGEVEHETDVGNLLKGRTHLERDVQSFIRGKPGTAESRKALVSSPDKDDKGDKSVRGSLKATAKAVKPQVSETAASGGLTAKAAAPETSSGKHGSAPPVEKKTPAKKAPVKTAQEQLRDLGGPVIVCKS
jgi:hypothetical protein